MLKLNIQGNVDFTTAIQDAIYDYTKQLVIHLKKWKLYSVKTKALNYTAETIQNTQFLMI
ncbi:hypothetical protein [Salmonella phage SD-2_S15]|nr:hypothetical protein [Salmonella phage SD-2_S15]